MCGKTAAQLMCFRSYVGLGYGAFWCGVIFDVEYKPLEDIKAQAKKFFLNNGDGCVWRESKSDYYFEWSGGERLYLRACKSVDDAENFKGHSYSFLGFNEISKWGTSEVLDVLLATQRSAVQIKDMPRIVFMTTNPDGAGVPWLRERYVNCAPAGQVVIDEVEIVLGDDVIEKVPKSKIWLAGSYIENEFCTKEDIANLHLSVANNPELAAAWLRCDWDAATKAGAVGSVWDRDVHIVPDFKIPRAWKLNRAMDWGSTEPFAIGWFAESNGEEFIHDGKKYCYPQGTVIMFYEWYGTHKLGTNRGLGLTPRQIAHGVLMRDHDFAAKGILDKGHKVYPGPADNQIANVQRTDIETIKSTMAKHGCRWSMSDKSPGSRVQGLQMLRQYLGNALTGEGKAFYVQRKCQATIKLLPSLQPDGEDIAKDQEDHLYDMIRYRLLTRRLGKPNIEFTVF